MIEFRQKDFSILSDIKKGALAGTAAGTTIAGGLKVLFRKGKEPDIKVPGKLSNISQEAIIIGGGTIIGAALGLLAGTVKELSKVINRSATVDNRLMQDVIDMLKKSGLKEGKNFTRDPKTANELKTKVCIVVTRVSNDLRLLINTVADPKLKEVTNGVVKHVKNTSMVTEKLSDKFNDITVSTISDSSADAGLITGIAQSFIHAGYPVYLVEVG